MIQTRGRFSVKILRYKFLNQLQILQRQITNSPQVVSCVTYMSSIFCATPFQNSIRSKGEENIPQTPRHPCTQVHEQAGGMHLYLLVFVANSLPKQLSSSYLLLQSSLPKNSIRTTLYAISTRWLQSFLFYKITPCDLAVSLIFRTRFVALKFKNRSFNHVYWQRILRAHCAKIVRVTLN